jgi:hypothetical protein
VREYVSSLDVAVAGFRPDRLHPQHYDVLPSRGQSDALLDGGPIFLLIGDHVVGGEDAQHRIGSGALDEKSRQARCRRGIARRRLTDDLLPQHGLQLFRDGLGEQVVGDHPKFACGGQGTQTIHGALDHGPRAIEHQELLGAPAAAPGPEACTAAAGQDNRTKLDFSFHLLLISWSA